MLIKIFVCGGIIAGSIVLGAWLTWAGLQKGEPIAGGSRLTHYCGCVENDPAMAMKIGKAAREVNALIRERTTRFASRHSIRASDYRASFSGLGLRASRRRLVEFQVRLLLRLSGGEAVSYCARLRRRPPPRSTLSGSWGVRPTTRSSLAVSSPFLEPFKGLKGTVTSVCNLGSPPPRRL